MGLLDAIRHQFIEVIEWLDSTGDTMVYRFPVQGQEIKNGAQLIVRRIEWGRSGCPARRLASKLDGDRGAAGVGGCRRERNRQWRHG